MFIDSKVEVGERGTSGSSHGKAEDLEKDVMTKSEVDIIKGE